MRFCHPSEGRREHGLALSRVRDLAKDRLQDFRTYENWGLEGLTDRTRRPFRYANQLPADVKAAIVAAKKEKPHWGARKIRERLLCKLPHAIKVPAASTVTPCWTAMVW